MQHVRVFVCTALVLLAASACETTAPEPYYLVAPSSIAPPLNSGLTRWDTRDELSEWVNNSFTTGAFRLLSEDVDFARIDLAAGTSSTLNSPNLQPVFTGLRSVRVRVRFVAAASSPTAVLNGVMAFVAWTGPFDPANPLMPAYYMRWTGPSSAWQTLELPSDPRGFPAVVDARWLYLTFGRSGPMTVDVDWIELVR
jgi:hypothetical protein